MVVCLHCFCSSNVALYLQAIQDSACTKCYFAVDVVATGTFVSKKEYHQPLMERKHKLITGPRHLLESFQVAYKYNCLCYFV